jgi:hypothetical protein
LATGCDHRDGASFSALLDQFEDHRERCPVRQAALRLGRAVAKVLSMGLVARRCFQCSAGKSPSSFNSRISAMSCTFRCTDNRGLPRSAGNSWQRDELQKIARRAVPHIWIDGISFEDEANLTEVILDNSDGLIEVVHQVVFRKREEARNAAQIRRVCNSR